MSTHSGGRSTRQQRHHALEAARTLERRFKSRDRYRRFRDRKLAVDWLGREFEREEVDQLTGRKGYLRLRLTSYNPANHTITMYPSGRDSKVVGQIVLTTDVFWSEIRTGRMLP